MDARRWLEQVRAELARRKLPPRYVARLVSELSDHVTDLMEDPMSMDACDLRDAVRPMGAPTDIADSAAKEYRKARFAGRHPVIAFVGMPMILLPLLWVGFVFAAILAVNLVMWCTSKADAPLRGPLPGWSDVSLRMVFQGIVLLPIIISAGVCCRIASKAGVNWKWPLIACLLLAVFGSLAVADMVLPTATSQGRFTFGLGVSARPHATQFVQFTLPIAIGGWFVWRRLAAGRRYAT